ncbi:MAG: TldD/PmbA family protein [Nitrospiraceae bacterium]
MTNKASTSSVTLPPQWETLAARALNAIRDAGADYGDIRLMESRTESLRGEDGRVAQVQDARDSGFGIRVLHRGAWGFAASAIQSLEEVPRIAALAVEVATQSARLMREPVTLAPEPSHRDVVVTSARIDPFAIPLQDKSGLLLDTMSALQRTSGIVRSRAELWARRDLKLFASTEGTHLAFDLLATQGECAATAAHDGRFASRSFNTPHLRMGYEVIDNAQFVEVAPRIAAQALEKVRAPAVDAGAYDLVLDGEHLSLTIHESCGHPSELDRALGYEANYAGTSFLTPNHLGRFQYGSEQVSLVADNTESGTLAATGYDDDGVACQRWEIVRDGTFVGYCTNREVAGAIGEARSRGSNRADGWSGVPMVRIANIGLQPGVGTPDDLIAGIDRGIYIEGHGSYSIDQRRYNFQFGGDAFWLIEHGRRTHMLRDVVYHGITPDFWGRCDGVADVRFRTRFGFITCGKGQPTQAGWMTHAASPARFRQVQVIRG